MPRNRSIYTPAHECTLSELLEQQAARTPHAIAVTYGPQRLPYRELNWRANQVARYLREHGAARGSLVGIGLDRSLDMIVAILGILKTGAAYVPLDPSYPPDRLAWMLADCGTPILLTASSLTERFSGYGGQVLCLDREWAAVRRKQTTNLEDGTQWGDRAYVMYTSGSAGWPKGVQIAHRSVVNAAHAMRAKVGMSASDVVLSVSSLSFDIQVLDMWMPLTCGASLAVAPAPACRDGEELAAEIDRTGATFMQATPSTWQLLLDSGWSGAHRLTAVCGGEMLASELAARLGKAVKSLWNAYGPTETTVWSAAYRAGGREDIVPIGRPLANTQFHVLDEQRRLVSTGIAGELFISGEGLALGYLNLPELTAERFIVHPFDRGGRRLYRTGDRVRQRPDGNFEFLGRLDRQVKVRGFRIELDEISAVLRRHPGVKDAATTLNEQKGGYKHLATYVITTPEDSAKPNELRDFLRATLPDYMVPTRLTFLDAFPRLPNGKLDYRGLSESEPYDASAADLPAPIDPLERRLASIFEELLGRGPVSTSQSFFDLGGDSVLAARLLRRIEDTVGTRVPMATVFQASTIEQLARILQEQPAASPAPGVIPIQTGGSGPTFLCLGAGPSFLPLVRLIGRDLRFLGLDLELIDPTQLPQPYRVEDIAAQFVQRIGEIEPQSPYYLGGWCRYGPLAYETARQLTAQGDEVALLTLIDSENPRHYRGLPLLAKAARGAQRVEYHLSKLTKSELADVPRYVRDRLRVVRYRMSGLRLRVKQRMGWPSGGTRTEELERILTTASARYDPPLYAGRLAIFQSVERPRGRHWDSAAGWRNLVRERSTVHDIPGNHESMLQEPHVRIFASRMRECLELESYAEVGAG